MRKAPRCLGAFPISEGRKVLSYGTRTEIYSLANSLLGLTANRLCNWQPQASRIQPRPHSTRRPPLDTAVPRTRSCQPSSRPVASLANRYPSTSVSISLRSSISDNASPNVSMIASSIPTHHVPLGARLAFPVPHHSRLSFKEGSNIVQRSLNSGPTMGLPLTSAPNRHLD
jgi:hypothetical protein